jgi:hypothetical protein
MNQTAVDWLIGQLYAPCRGIPSHIIEQAKEMEKEQIINANRDGVDMVVDKKDFISGEQYYNKTFNTNEK